MEMVQVRDDGELDVGVCPQGGWVLRCTPKTEPVGADDRSSVERGGSGRT